MDTIDIRYAFLWHGDDQFELVEPSKRSSSKLVVDEFISTSSRLRAVNNDSRLGTTRTFDGWLRCCIVYGTASQVRADVPFFAVFFDVSAVLRYLSPLGRTPSFLEIHLSALRIRLIITKKPRGSWSQESDTVG